MRVFSGVNVSPNHCREVRCQRVDVDMARADQLDGAVQARTRVPMLVAWVAVHVNGDHVGDRERYRSNVVQTHFEFSVGFGRPASSTCTAAVCFDQGAVDANVCSFVHALETKRDTVPSPC